MKIYSGARRNGKTTKLIIDAELHDRVILVRDRQRAKNIENDDAETVLQDMVTDYTDGRGIVEGITITTWESLDDAGGIL